MPDPDNRRSAKTHAVQAFERYVSPAKVAFFRQAGMDFVMGRRAGAVLEDLTGDQALFNLHCNGGVFNLGHRHPEVIAALQEALQTLDIGNHHLLSAERAALAARLAELLPEDLDISVFGTGGGEAVDLALKVARAYTGRATIVSARGGYHGHTGLALAAGDAKYRAPFGPQPPGFVQIPFGDLEALEAALAPPAAAVLLETIPATLGIVLPPPGYLAGVRRLCDRRGALLILDEVQTGLGRTGSLWGFTPEAVVPDMVVLGKGLSGGLYPISATVLRRPLAKVFDADPFIHISTFGGAELGCRVAAKVLEISTRADFLPHVGALADAFARGLAQLRSRHATFLCDVRQRGLMIGLGLPDPLCGPLLSKAAYDQGLLMVYANNDPAVCQCLPPLVMDPAKVPWVLESLDRALGAAAEWRAAFGETP
jgi:putrescine aminotransferase